MAKQANPDIKNYRRRLLRHHWAELEAAIAASAEMHLVSDVDWAHLTKMLTQLTADIGKDQAVKMLRRLSDRTAKGDFLSFSKTDLTEI